MKRPSIHFIYDKCKEPDASFAAGLVAAFGQARLKSAKNVVTIGGDGTLLHALRKAVGKQITGIIPPGSNSRGFLTNRNIITPDDLTNVLETAKSYPIHPLRADIEFADGSSVSRFGYNDIAIRPVHQKLTAELKKNNGLGAHDVSVQAALLNLRVSFAEAVIGPYRIMGGGLIFATSLGSTAMNHAYGGPSIDIRNDMIVLTGIGVSEPHKGFNPIVNSGDTIFTINVESHPKRPVIVGFDSFGTVQCKKNNPIKKITISAAKAEQTHIILTDDPGTRAYSAMTP